MSAERRQHATDGGFHVVIAAPDPGGVGSAVVVGSQSGSGEFDRLGVSARCIGDGIECVILTDDTEAP
jgi:hypothetical protein